MKYQNKLKLTKKNFKKNLKTWKRNMLAGNYQTLLNKSFQIRTKKELNQAIRRTQ